ncbi:hypothetical protein R1flu_014510 [Riccia fluitans]|uniref:Uncharacterized protein n=1 Tax=Riccia fluitans TaxID=41844 RepID=A0ABD1YGA6_9MARC
MTEGRDESVEGEDNAAPAEVKSAPDVLQCGIGTEVVIINSWYDRSARPLLLVRQECGSRKMMLLQRRAPPHNYLERASLQFYLLLMPALSSVLLQLRSLPPFAILHCISL